MNGLNAKLFVAACNHHTSKILTQGATLALNFAPRKNQTSFVSFAPG